MKVWIKEPGKTFHPEEIENSLEKLQQTVGGYIETLTVKDEPDREEWAVVVCNEEGLLLNLDRNVMIGGHTLVGTIIICGQDGDEFTDAPEWIRETCIRYNRRMGFNTMNYGELFEDAMNGDPV